MVDPDYFMIPTAEGPVTNLHRDENDALTFRFNTAHMPASVQAEFRRTRRYPGIDAQYHFNKVELVKFARPEDSYQELEKLTNDAERVLQLLGPPYRVGTPSTGDLGFSLAKTYDIEVWMPSYGRYLEISSCSNFEDYHARAAIRFKDSPRKRRSSCILLRSPVWRLGARGGQFWEIINRKTAA